MDEHDADQPRPDLTVGVQADELTDEQLHAVTGGSGIKSAKKPKTHKAGGKQQEFLTVKLTEPI